MSDVIPNSKIDCTVCKGISSTEMGDVFKGCSQCGGYGYVAFKIKVKNGEIYVRPDPVTWYEGKIFTSYDGKKCQLLGDGTVIIKD